MAADVALYLPDDLLVKSDLTAMAHGLEGRSPLLDHELMEWAASLPIELKIRRRRGKYLLRRLAAPLLPPFVSERPKMGFGVPLDRWLRGELSAFTRDIVCSRAALERGILEPRAVRQLLDEHVSGARSHAHRLWALLMLELWFRECVDGARSVGTIPAAAVPSG
jgi:asparagine synthase (glutamine-hydrolysing)